MTPVRHAHYVGFNQAHRIPRNPPDSAREELTIVAGLTAILVVIAAVAQLLNPAVPVR